MFMIVKFSVLENYIISCSKKGLEPTWEELRAYQK
jgi:hypothetical protein